MKSNRQPQVIMILVITSLLLLTLPHCKRQSIGAMLQRGHAAQAEEACLSREGQEKTDAAALLAEYYFKNNTFSKAAQFYEIAGNHSQAVSSLLLNNNPDQAEAYCRRQTGPAVKVCARIIGGYHYRNGDYEKAIDFYRQGEDTQKVKWVQKQIPIFMQRAALKQFRPTVKDSRQSMLLDNLLNILTDYLAMENMYTWRRPRLLPNDENTALQCKEIWKKLESSVIPTLTEKIATLASGTEWQKADWDSLEYMMAKLKHLSLTIRHLDALADNRPFFTTPSNPAKQVNETLPSAKNSKIPELYETLRLKALELANGVLETLKYGENEATADQYPDVLNDFKVDTDILGYLAELLDNIKTRFREIDDYCSHMEKISPTPETAATTRRIRDYFRKGCENVLENALRKDYEGANLQLLNTYGVTKKETTALGKTLQIE